MPICVLVNFRITAAMKFLVILICLTINYLWLKDFDRFDDGWFFRFRRRMEEWAGSAESNSEMSGLLPLLFTYGIPLVSLGVLILVLEGSAFGLPTMLLHILVLLVAFDRTQPGNIVKCFLQRWREGDSEACINYLSTEMWVPEDNDLSDDKALSEFFKEQLIYRCFEKMFVMFFWYMLTGPLGIMFCYISYQLRDTQHENQAEIEGVWVQNIIHLLEWIPIRLLAIAFSLAGNFVRCFENLKKSFWVFRNEEPASVRLYSYAGCALSDSQNAAVDTGGTGSEEWRKSQEREIEDIQALLERSQAIWLAVLALITIFGIQSV